MTHSGDAMTHNGDAMTDQPTAPVRPALATTRALQIRTSLLAAPAVAARPLATFLLASACIVYAMTIATAVAFAGGAGEVQRAGAAALPNSPAARVETADLPRPVREMRDMILAAVESGRLDDLVGAVEWNEIRPDFGEDDPARGWLAHLKSLSADGTGRDILDLLGRLLASPAARLPVGRDFENNALFVWPYLSERRLDNLSPSEAADLANLVPPDAIRTMTERKKWAWWRLAIGGDGTWHVFRKID